MTRRCALLAMLALSAVAAAAPEGAQRNLQRYRSPGKPTAPLAIRYDLAAEPALGVPLTIAVEVEPGAAMTNVALEARADEKGPLVLLAVTPAGVEGRAHRWSVSVLPTRAANGYVSLLASGDLAGERQVRSVLVPVRFVRPEEVGSSTAAASAAGNGEERIVELPAVTER